MQKFSEFVNDYKKYRVQKGLSAEVSADDVKKIRELYESLNSKKTKIKESEECKEKGECTCGNPECKGENCDCENKKETFEEALEKYRAWKFKKSGTRGVTEKEKAKIRESLSLKESEGSDDKPEFERCEACGDACPKTYTVSEYLENVADEEDKKLVDKDSIIDELNENGYVSDVNDEMHLCPFCIQGGIDRVVSKKPVDDESMIDENYRDSDDDDDVIDDYDNEEHTDRDEEDDYMDYVENVKDNQLEESIEGFKKIVGQYREWKKAKYNTAKLTEKEKSKLKEKFLERLDKLNEAKKEEPKENARLNESIAQYKEWKKANHGTDELTKTEESNIAKSLVLDDIKEKLNEAKKFVESGKKHLTEGDLMEAGADAQAAAGAVNDANAMGADPALASDPNAGAALPQNIVDEIAQIKTSIDALATECGIESPVDLGADAGAGVPAVTGVADPNVDATAVAEPNAGVADPNAVSPLPESIKSIKDRIEKRKEALKEKTKFSNTKMDGEKDTVKIPSESELVNGTKSGIAKAADWPVKDVKPSDTKKLKNIEECTQEELAKMTLDESSGEFSWANYTKMLKSL